MLINVAAVEFRKALIDAMEIMRFHKIENAWKERFEHWDKLIAETKKGFAAERSPAIVMESTAKGLGDWAGSKPVESTSASMSRAEMDELNRLRTSTFTSQPMQKRLHELQEKEQAAFKASYLKHQKEEGEMWKKVVESTHGQVITGNTAYGNKAAQGLGIGPLDSTSLPIGFDQTVNPVLRMDPYAPVGVLSKKRSAKRKVFNTAAMTDYLDQVSRFLDSLDRGDIINICEDWYHGVVVWYWAAEG